MERVRWGVVVTTVPKRRHGLLPRTLMSLRKSGFTRFRLCVDGCPHEDARGWADEFGCEVTTRWPAIRTYGNWMLSLAECYIRDPHCDRYAVFQDDFVTGKNLREYLERCPTPVKGYLNLYTFPQNFVLCPKGNNGQPRVGWYQSNQLGKGAVALVFPNEGVLSLLTHQHVVKRPKNAGDLSWRFVDGGIIEAMKQAGWHEYVHNPSLVQHTGIKSSMGNWPHPPAPNFRGEDYDYLDLLPG